jgi:hypothetical protein
MSEPQRTAAEVIAQNADVSRRLGSIYGRFLDKLLTPLLARAFTILKQERERDR